jgi:signal transduction histidine kinase
MVNGRRRRREGNDPLDRANQLITDEQLWGWEHHQQEHRVGEDRGLAIALAVLSCLQVAIVTHMSFYAGMAATLSLQPHPGPLPYALVIACFLPLAWRRSNPIAVLAVTSVFAALYFAMPWPPTIVVAAPMLALYTVASRYGGRRAFPVGVVLLGMLLGVSAMTVSLSYTIAQAVGTAALLGLSAAMGHGAQTRRELFDEIVRTRKEESRRRQEEERLRIAREVHDIMAHSLTLMTVQADAGLAVFDDRPERSREALQIVGETGRETLRDLRSMLEVLTQGEDDSPREPVADLSGLGGLVASVRDAGLGVSLVTEGDLAAVPTAIAVSAYRIVQESLTNAVRHSAAEEVTVRVAATPAELSVDVADDGPGTDAESAGAGRGIAGMRERVAALGGTFEAGTVDTGGFRVSARIPLTRSSTCRSA